VASCTWLAVSGDGHRLGRGGPRSRIRRHVFAADVERLGWSSRRSLSVGL
jgi:hypothetical protein